MRKGGRRSRAGLAWALVACPALATAALNTDFLAQPWPRQHVRHYEVWRYDVRWRERLDRKQGIFTGVQFDAPLEQQKVWDLANDYSDVGTTVPGVTAVRYLERSPTHELIQVDIKVLWKALTLTIEVEQDPPHILRFRFVNNAIVEYLGVCTFDQHLVSTRGKPPTPSTIVEISTWLKPARPVPMRLLLIVERMAMLNAAREFLKACEHHRAIPPPPT